MAKVVQGLAELKKVKEAEAKELEEIAAIKKSHGCDDDVLLHKAHIARQRAAVATEGHPSYKALLKRVLNNLIEKMPELKNLPRGHNPDISVKFPGFRSLCEQAAHELSARADPSRASVTLSLGSSSWITMSDRLANPDPASGPAIKVRNLFIWVVYTYALGSRRVIMCITRIFCTYEYTQIQINHTSYDF